MGRLASEVDGAPGHASDAMTATTSHTTPDTRLIASSAAAEGEPRSSGKGRVCSKSLPLPLQGAARPARAGLLIRLPRMISGLFAGLPVGASTKPSAEADRDCYRDRAVR